MSAVVFGGVPGRILQRLLFGDIELFLSSRLLNDFERILVERFRADAVRARAARDELAAAALLTEPIEVPRVARDPDDDYVLATAIAGPAEVIVTGDTDLLELVEHRGVRIVTPRQFLDELGLEAT